MPVFSFIRSALFLLLFSALFAAGGCASTPPVTRTVRVAVLDGKREQAVPPEGEMTQEGWWFSARDRFRSPAVGGLLGEALSNELAELEGVDVYSRRDLRVYMAQKERLLRRNFTGLTSWQRKQLLLEQPPLDYGRSLNVDYVVRPVIRKSSLVTNSFIAWWYTTLSASVEVWDVERDQLLRVFTWEDTDAFDSQLSMAEECAREVSRQARRDDVFLVHQ